MALFTMTSASYGLLAVNLLSEDLMKKVYPQRDFRNSFFLVTCLGGTLYVASSPYFDAMKCRVKKYCFSFCGYTFFTMGSAMCWILLGSHILPNNTPIRAAAAVGSSIVLLKTGTSLLDIIGAGKNEQGKKAE